MVIIALISAPKFPSLAWLCEKLLDAAYTILTPIMLQLMDTATRSVHILEVTGLGKPLLMLYDVVPTIFDTQNAKLLELGGVQRSLVSLETAWTFDAVRNVKERQPR